jgi:hypothetical protein
MQKLARRMSGVDAAMEGFTSKPKKQKE